MSDAQEALGAVADFEGRVVDRLAGDDGGESDVALDVDGVVAELVDYVFGQAFAEGDEGDRDAFVDAFRENGRYRRHGDGDLTVLGEDRDEAKGADPDYLALHEVYVVLSDLPESDRPVAVQCLGTQLLARQAAEVSS